MGEDPEVVLQTPPRRDKASGGCQSPGYGTSPRSQNISGWAAGPGCVFAPQVRAGAGEGMCSAVCPQAAAMRLSGWAAAPGCVLAPQVRALPSVFPSVRWHAGFPAGGRPMALKFSTSPQKSGQGEWWAQGAWHPEQPFGAEIIVRIGFTSRSVPDSLTVAARLLTHEGRYRPIDIDRTPHCVFMT